jgi:hypothetical protein
MTNAPAGDGADIGAYEVQADQLPGCTTMSKVVNNNNDSGAGSLRGLIADVCAGSTITFAADVRGTITLTSDELFIDKFLTIAGPGANQLAIRRSSAFGTPEFRILQVAQRDVVTITGLTIANGRSQVGKIGAPYYYPGAGVFNDGTLTLNESTISGNTGPAEGGGIVNGGNTNDHQQYRF